MSNLPIDGNVKIIYNNHVLKIKASGYEVSAPLPGAKFLLKAAKKLKKEVENKGEEEEVDKHDGNDGNE